MLMFDVSKVGLLESRKPLEQLVKKKTMREKPVPVGLLAEECQEASNKVVKFTREHHTRKFSRTITNLDVMRRLLANSDPVITSKRSLHALKHLELPEEAQQLLK